MSSTDKTDENGAGIPAEHVKPLESSASEEASKIPKMDVGDVPDPDEDDLDDLDDMLDEFSAVKVDVSKPVEAPPSQTAQPKSDSKTPVPPPETNDPTGDDFSEDEFAKQLQAGMADLLGELENSPDMQAQFEDMFKQMSAAAADGPDTATEGASGIGASAPRAASPSAAEPTETSFQETIRRTMERMQNSGDQATAAATSGGEEDFMAEMLKQLSSGDFKGEGNDEDFSKMLMGMMEQLTNKDILYEPMKELNDKFPEWLDKNRTTTPAEDIKRFEEQKVIVAEIVTKFEERSYSDSNSADREYIVDRMQKMQAAGSPPPDLVGDMASAQDALNMPDDQCNPQ